MPKMDWLVYFGIGVGSAGVGAAVTYWFTKNPPPPIVIREEVAKEQIEVQKNLTQTDLLKVPCSLEYIKDNSEALCREMFCRMTTRGIDSKTSGSECESISNTINKSFILKICASKSTSEEQRSCIEFFDRRI
tara:strand:+ start:391 stop:789 length:399 start_codon:yes stop_codon:yes gene_type:complete